MIITKNTPLNPGETRAVQGGVVVLFDEIGARLFAVSSNWAIDRGINRPNKIKSDHIFLSFPYHGQNNKGNTCYSSLFGKTKCN
jgi:hypothetical protein